MNHPVPVEQLSAYIDGRLSRERHEAVRDHIAQCAECGRTIGYLSGYKTFVSRLTEVRESADFDLRFRERLERAIAERAEYRPSAFEIAARRMIDDLKDALIPNIPALVRVGAAVIIVATAAMFGSLYLGVDTPLIVARKGDVRLIGPSGAEVVRYGFGRKLTVGTTITVAKGSSVDIEVSRKFAVRLKGASRIRVAKLAPKFRPGDVTFELTEGMVYVTIDKAFKGSRFYLTTDTAEVRALGTKFAVDATEKIRKKTWVGVLEGAVEVTDRPQANAGRQEKKVVVSAGQMTVVLLGEIPQKPERLAEDEWRELEELYQIGRRLKMLLIIRNTPDRVMEALRPAPFYIADEDADKIPDLVRVALTKINEAIQSKDRGKHLEAINALKRVIAEHPDPQYNPQLMVFIGAYYRFVGDYEKAIEMFERVVREYPESTFASIAQCAIGVVYEKDLRDLERASQAYTRILRDYPDSLEAIWIETNIHPSKDAA